MPSSVDEVMVGEGGFFSPFFSFFSSLSSFFNGNSVDLEVNSNILSHY